MAFRKARPASTGGLLPGYEGLVEIGGGAFATVFRAVETETGRPVALKILKVDTIHARLIETFQREIQALAQVSDHPNIVTLYRPSTTVDGRPVLVLELCKGSLGSRVRTSGPLAVDEVVRVGVKIAAALETAHRNGFLHRDMKPQNILVTNFGEPALADFGVAALQASAQATAGVFGFTTLHAAPEMLEGHHLSPATDVYGLASTMYQLLTGQAPFATFDNEAPASVILRILRDPVPPLRVQHIPLSLSDLLERSLSKQPEGRPRSALDFAHALQTVEEEQGWPATDFVAWGHDRVPAESRPASPPGSPPGAARPEPPGGARPAQPPGSPRRPSVPRDLPPYPTAPAVRVDSVESPAARTTLPPLLPPAAEDGPPDDPPDLPEAHVAGPLPDPGSPPAARRGPSVARPEPGTRNVVAPSATGRGQPAPPIRPPGVPLQPLAPGDQSESARSGAPSGPRAVHRDRPVFVDPPAPGPEQAPPPSGSVHQRRVEARRPFRVEPPAGTPTERSLPAFRPLALAALALAAVVLIAAVLMLAGLI